MDCLDENRVLDLLRGRLSASEASLVDRHVDGCSLCRELVGQVVRTTPKSWSIADGPSSDEGALLVSESVDGSGIPDAAGVGAGDQLSGRFRLLRMVGRGAMGLVYEAEDELLKIRVALKLLRADVAARPSVLKHLYREILVGRRISHPNVCRIYDIGRSENVHFISMEFIRGETLESLVSRAPVAREQLLSILEQIAAALTAAHEVGVVHRDLKPSNIMIDENQKVTVMDFGLARDLQGDQSDAGLIGTPAYWAPEQARGEPATIASDIYAFGVIAHQLSTGHRPPLTDRRSAIPRVTPRLRAIVARCLEPDPRARFGSAKELVSALQAIQPNPARARNVSRVGAAIAFAALLGLAYVLPSQTAITQSPLAATPPRTQDAHVASPAPLTTSSERAPLESAPAAGTAVPTARPTQFAGSKSPRPRLPKPKKPDLLFGD